MDWQVFTLIGSDFSSREIAFQLHCSVGKVWRIRSKLARNLNLRGPKLVTTAVKCLWIQQHEREFRHIALVFHDFTDRLLTPKP